MHITAGLTELNSGFVKNVIRLCVAKNLIAEVNSAKSFVLTLQLNQEFSVHSSGC